MGNLVKIILVILALVALAIGGIIHSITSTVKFIISAVLNLIGFLFSPFTEVIRLPGLWPLFTFISICLFSFFYPNTITNNAVPWVAAFVMSLAALKRERDIAGFKYEGPGPGPVLSMIASIIGLFIVIISTHATIFRCDTQCEVNRRAEEVAHRQEQLKPTNYVISRKFIIKDSDGSSSLSDQYYFVIKPKNGVSEKIYRLNQGNAEKIWIKANVGDTLTVSFFEGSEFEGPLSSSPGLLKYSTQKIYWE